MASPAPDMRHLLGWARAHLPSVFDGLHLSLVSTSLAPGDGPMPGALIAVLAAEPFDGPRPAASPRRRRPPEVSPRRAGLRPWRVIGQLVQDRADGLGLALEVFAVLPAWDDDSPDLVHCVFVPSGASRPDLPLDQVGCVVVDQGDGPATTDEAFWDIVAWQWPA